MKTQPCTGRKNDSVAMKKEKNDYSFNRHVQDGHGGVAEMLGFAPFRNGEQNLYCG